MTSYPIPGWVFEHPEDGTYYLLQLRPDGTVNVDGSHSSPQGVARAKYLTENIAVLKARGQGSRYVMVQVTEVPPSSGEGVDHKAIWELNQMTERQR